MEAQGGAGRPSRKAQQVSGGGRGGGGGLPPRAAREQASAFMYTHFRWRSTLSTAFEGLGVL